LTRVAGALLTLFNEFARTVYQSVRQAVRVDSYLPHPKQAAGISDDAVGALK
jgi:hypothetical protein